MHAGAFLGVGYVAGDVLESWSVRLGLDQAEVAELVAEQPALLEMSPNTVKARLVRGVCSCFACLACFPCGACLIRRTRERASHSSFVLRSLLG